jgi:hypothetical protein
MSYEQLAQSVTDLAVGNAELAQRVEEVLVAATAKIKVNASYPFTFVAGQSQYDVEVISGDATITTAGMVLWIEAGIEYAFTVDSLKKFTLLTPEIYADGQQMRIIVNARYDHVFDQLDSLYADEKDKRLQDYLNYLNTLGLEAEVPYVAGISLVRPTQVVRYLDVNYRPLRSALPFTTSTWAVDSAKLIQAEDITLRQALGSNGAEIVSLKQGGKVQDAINWITPEMHGAVGGDAAVDTPAIIAALADGVETGRCVQFDSSKTYAINAAIVTTLGDGDSLRVSFNGAKFHQIGNIVPFSFYNTLSSALVAVTSLTKVSVNLGDGTTNSFVSMMEAPGHDFVVGDIAKIFSDDIVPDTDGSSQMIGEWFVVGKVDGDFVYATGGLVENYTTGIMLAKPSKARMHVETGPYIYTDDSTVNNAAAFNVRGFIKPMLLGAYEGNDLNATFFNLTSCYFAQVGIVAGDALHNEPTQAQYGYVFNDSASFGTQVDTIVSHHARHGFTTTTPNRVAGDGRWDLSGRSMYPKVRNVVMQGNANGVDTHSPAYKPHFGTITVLNDYRGNATGGAGLQIRGNSARIDSLEVINSKVGLAISCASKTSDSFLSIGQMRIKTEQGALPVSISGNALFKNKVVIDNLDVDTTHDNVILTTYSSVIVKYLNLNFSPYQNGGQLFELGEGAVLDCLDGDVYINTGSGHVLAKHTADLTVCRAKLRVTGASHVSYLASSSATYDINSEWDVHLDTWTGTPFLGLIATNPKPFAKIRVGSTQYPLRLRSYVDGNPTVTGNNSINLQNAGDPVIFVKVQTSLTGVQLNSVTRGAFVGQMLVVNNHSSSTQNITIINNSSGLVITGSSVVLAPGEAKTLIWDGSFWRRAS